MSCRHAEPASSTATTSSKTIPLEVGRALSGPAAGGPDKVRPTIRKVRPTIRSLFRNGRHLPWTERVKEGARLLEIEPRVPRLDAEKEAIAAGKREPRHVEDRVIRHRQAVEGQ